MKRVAGGMIGEPDMALTNVLLDWRCVTERQIRRLTNHAFAKEHQAGTRLRTLQKIDWFDGLWYQKTGKEREHVWFLGSAAFHYYSIVHRMQLLDPLRMLQFKDYMLSLCAINELRLILEERGRYTEVEYAPTWVKGETIRPFSRFCVESSRGPLTLYVERVTQKGRPLSLMQKKIALYEQMAADNDGKLPAVKPGPVMVVWSVGSIQAIRELVGSIDYIPDHFVQAFLPDECLSDFPFSFYLAQKGSKVGDVQLQQMNMDIL
jgi:hypothetical protein